MHGHVRSVPSLHGSVGVDLLFSRVLGSLPAPLAQSLREAELDEAATLRDYPWSTADQLKDGMSREELPAPSGATPTGKSSSTYGNKVPVHAVGMAPTERLKLRRQMAAAAGKKSTTSLSLFMEAYGLEVEEELSTMATQTWAGGVWIGKMVH